MADNEDASAARVEVAAKPLRHGSRSVQKRITCFALGCRAPRGSQTGDHAPPEAQVVWIAFPGLVVAESLERTDTTLGQDLQLPHRYVSPVQNELGGARRSLQGRNPTLGESTQHRVGRARARLLLASGRQSRVAEELLCRGAILGVPHQDQFRKLRAHAGDTITRAAESRDPCRSTFRLSEAFPACLQRLEGLALELGTELRIHAQ